MTQSEFVSALTALDAAPLSQASKDTAIAALVRQFTAVPVAAPAPTHTSAMGTQVLDSAHESEVEQILRPGGIQWPAPPGGWPPKSQFTDGRAGTYYVHTDSQGGGFWADTLPAVAIPHYPDSQYTAADKMNMQYQMSAGGAGHAQRAAEDMAADFNRRFGTDGPMAMAMLGQMFGSSGDARFYNPYAGTMMGALVSGLPVPDAKVRLAGFAATETSAGAKESMAQLDDAWFAQAAATVAKYA